MGSALALKDGDAFKVEVSDNWERRGRQRVESEKVKGEDHRGKKWNASGHEL
jgi:hypothetical protein